MVRSGRFGLYVTDGETNATLRLGDTPESMTMDRASELLAERRNAEPSTRVRKVTKKAGRAPAKKLARKAAGSATKTTAKKATKSTSAQKRAAIAQGAAANAALLAGQPEDS